MSESQDWQRIWDVFEAALEQPEESRASWLDETCGDDDSLRQQVDRLLEAHAKEDGVLDAEVSSFAAAALESEEPAKSDEQIGPYRVEREIGRGGMAVVYKAQDPRLGRYVALKFVSPHLTSTSQGKQRMESEARAASRLDHPNICTIYDIGETPDGRLYLAMAYYEGETLAERLRRGALPLDEALAITAQIARALDHAHEAGVIHRDIKPSNVLLTARGEVKVLDFGLAKQGGLTITESGMRVGTVHYASPEQARGEKVDTRTDLWSLGVTLYEMLVGRPPFSGEEALGVLYKIVHDDLNISAVPQEVAPVVRKLLAKNPGGRYESAQALLDDLGAPLSSVSDPGSGVALRGEGMRGWQIGLVAALAVVAVLVGAQLFLGSIDQDTAMPNPPVPLTSTPGSEELASFSPDGSRVVFAWDGPEADNVDIYVRYIDSPELLRLTDDPAWDSSPAWSPNGSEIAFLREISEGRTELLLTTPLGGAERRLATVAGSVRSGLSWSPDGERILVADRSPTGVPEVASVTLSSQEKQTVISAPEGSIQVRSPVFSPDGEKVGFDVLRGIGLGDTYVYSEGEPKRITFSGEQPEGLAWTRDGQELLFARLASDGRRNMWRVPVAGGAPSPLRLGDNPTQPALSHSEDRLAFSKRVSSYGIVRIDAEGAVPPSRFLHSTQFDATPHFSPDGTQIAFSSGRSGDVEIWLSDADGSNVRQLTYIGTAGSPRWSPDGKQIVFDAIAEGNADIFAIGVQGGKVRRITLHEAEDIVPSFSRDGKWIYFCSVRSGQLQVWKVPADSTEGSDAQPVQVTQDGGFHALESIDGTTLYYSKSREGENSIWTKPLDGGAEEVLIDGVDSGWGNWHLAEEGIYFVRSRREAESAADRGWSVFFFRYRDRNVSEVVPLTVTPTRGGEGIDVSADGRWILMGHVVVESDLMLVEGFR